MIENRSILLTGGAGFIGSHLAGRLAVENEVTVFDSLRTGRVENVPQHDSIKLIDGDVTNADAIHSVVPGHDIVVHLAALVGVDRTLENPVEVLETNIEGTEEVLQAAVDADVDRFLFSSTSEVYGDGVDVPYSETDRTCPKTDYAVAKLADERLIQAYAREYEIDYTILRFFNIYGPRQDSSHYGYVVPIFVRQALQNNMLEVHGDGAQTRDFTYIDDAVEGTVKALGPAGANEIFNLGHGQEVSIESLAEKIIKTVGKGEVRYVDHPRPYSINRRCADISRANKLLNYNPDVSLQSGIKKLAESLTENGGL